MIWWFVKTSPAGRFDWSLSSALVDWAQVLGAGFSLVALIVAFWAVWKARHDLAVERRTTYELEVLRDLGEKFGYLGKTAASAAMTAHSLLMLLPDSNDLPMMRAAVGARPSPGARDDFNEKYPHFEESPTFRGLNEWQLRFQQLSLVREDGTFRRELDEAVERRLA
jgi:hypothetical protein